MSVPGPQSGKPDFVLVDKRDCGASVGRGNCRSLVNLGAQQGMGSIDGNETRRHRNLKNLVVKSLSGMVVH